MSQHPNAVLALMSNDVLARMQPHLDVVPLESGAVLGEPFRRIPHAYFPHSAMNRVTVQIRGEASGISLAQFAALMLEISELRKGVIRFEQYLFAQAQQTGACNAHHTVSQKLCKWLLRMHDLTGPVLPLTQEFIAYMIGVRRTSVSDAAKTLQADGLIDYHRGTIRVLNKTKMESQACECADDLRNQYRDAMLAEEVA
ncbi:Crp/Fnr family transcriptional regulator [Tardiphaga sp.]|jgi:CRP-like cAMP-binding protein|uniref:Crp/Fnr family transcriptional regulator n=1 Tax=Tardiphaga sp. TaxID=1926292 RepID=UPI0037DA379A